MKKKNYLYVARGDIIEIDLPIIGNTQVKVLEMIQRYGTPPLFPYTINPLIVGKFITPHKCEYDHNDDFCCPHCKNTGFITQQSFNLGYVTKIIKRCKLKGIPKYNKFNKTKENYLVKETKNNLTGSFIEVLMFTISKMNIEVYTGINLKSFDLYFKTGYGLISQKNYGEGIYEITVNKKRFKKWVWKNINRIFITSKEMHKIETKRMEEYEKQYWDECDLGIKEDKKYYN